MGRAVSMPAGLRIALLAAGVAVCSPGGVAAQNPCPAAPADPAFRNAVPAAPPLLGGDKRSGFIDDGARWGVLDSLWNHRTAVERGLLRPMSATESNEDEGEIAVLQDEGDLFRASNIYDLRDVTLRFAANDDGGYDVTHRGAAAWRSPPGESLTLGDDDSVPLALQFEFPFYAATHDGAFVNSDGNLTFEEGDSASTARGVSRLLTGPPRVALFLSDLDPSAGGAVYAQAGADAVTVTWCDVPGFESQSTTTVQVSLLSTGVIEMTFDPDVGLGDAIVGLSPGRTAAFESVDLSDTAGAGGGAAAMGERFAVRGELDTVAVARKFLLSHPDAYDQIVIWTDWPVLFDAFAYEITIGNRIEGIGQAIYDIPADFGSESLTSIVVMGWLGKYSDDAEKKVSRENTTLSLLAHETGHRWLAFMEFSNHDRERSEALLGRQRAHWSFFFDSDASVMEGNDIEDLGGGSFRTVAAVEGYSALDQYAMGLRHDHEVPAFFYVEAPTNAMPPARGTGSPQVGVTFNGTKREVLIADVIEVEGARVPSADEAPRVHRQAFVYVVGNGREANSNHVARLDTIRGQWEPFFAAATDERMRVETRLRPPASTATTDP
ncbi:MAG: hypothetical protein J4G16_08490 [Acidobacteria bacterium]|nr:hypothetical protein [Acidobacteriota bacterium]